MELESAYDQWNIDDGGIIWWEQCVDELFNLFQKLWDSSTTHQSNP